MGLPLQFFVPGVPVGQGSKTGFVNKRTGKVVIVEGRKADARQRHADWRAAVRLRASDRWGEDGVLSGPLSVVVTFYLPRPASAPKTKRTYPIGKQSGDLDKLVRSVFDSLTGVVWGDDAQVMKMDVSKDYGTRPGVSVLVDLWEEPDSLPLAGRGA